MIWYRRRLVPRVVGGRAWGVDAVAAKGSGWQVARLAVQKLNIPVFPY